MPSTKTPCATLGKVTTPVVPPRYCGRRSSSGTAGRSKPAPRTRRSRRRAGRSGCCSTGRCTARPPGTPAWMVLPLESVAWPRPRTGVEIGAAHRVGARAERAPLAGWAAGPGSRRRPSARLPRRWGCARVDRARGVGARARAGASPRPRRLPPVGRRPSRVPVAGACACSFEPPPAQMVPSPGGRGRYAARAAGGDGHERQRRAPTTKGSSGIVVMFPRLGPSTAAIEPTLQTGCSETQFPSVLHGKRREQWIPRSSPGARRSSPGATTPAGGCTRAA